MRCSVRELLDRFDSLELAEWRAFEMALGPIGPEYTNGTLAAIHEQLQVIAYVIGAQYGDESPIEEPRHFPRPNEMFIPRSEMEEAAAQAPMTEIEAQAEVAGADALSAYFDELEAAN